MDRFGDVFGKKFLGSALDQFLFRDAGFLGTQTVSDHPFNPGKTNPNSAAVLQIVTENLHKGVLEPTLIGGVKIIDMNFIHSLGKFGEVVPLTQRVHCSELRRSGNHHKGWEDDW